MSATVSSPFGAVLDGASRAAVAPSSTRSQSHGARKVMAKADSAESFRDSLRAARDSILAEPPSAEVAKPIVEGWVDELALQRKGNRTAAYHAAAWLFDCSESWIRRLLAGNVDAFSSDRYQRIVASQPHLRERQRARGFALIGDDATTGFEGGDAP